MESRIHYSDRAKIAALAALEQVGNVSAVSALFDIPERTLYAWQEGRGVPVDIIEDLKVGRVAMADRLEALAHHAIDLMPAKMPEASLVQLATTMGIAIDKMRLLREQATAITEHHVLSIEIEARASDLASRFNLDPELAARMLSESPEP